MPPCAAPGANDDRNLPAGHAAGWQKMLQDSGFTDVVIGEAADTFSGGIHRPTQGTTGCGSGGRGSRHQ